MTNVIFMGTPAFAASSLAALVDHGYKVVAVVTQPDAPAGRGKTVTQPPVKQFALSRGLIVLQPESLKLPEIVDQLRSLQPDLIVVAAFGQILRQNVLDLPKHGCINVHASLLPRWRGASPISAAIAAGDEITGITIMLMEAGLDSGPILSHRSEPIHPDDTTGSLAERLARRGAELLSETLPRYLKGEIIPQKQDESFVTFAGRLKKEDGRIDWSRSAVEIERHVRAMSPWPSAFTSWQGKQLKVLKSKVGSRESEVEDQPGTVRVQQSNGLTVQCGAGILELIEVQPEGKRAMRAADFARGQPALNGGLLQ